MKLLIIFALFRTVSMASTFRPFRGLTNYTLEQQLSAPVNQENEAGLYSRITNGHAAADNQFAYQVGVQTWVADDKVGRCGGSIISVKWVLTAAHCLNGVRYDLFIGSILFAEPRVAFYRVPRSKIIQHAHYDEQTYEHDIGLIQIPQIHIPDGISHVYLPPRSAEQYVGKSAYLTGWGTTSDSPGELSPNLLYATFRIITNEKCHNVYGSPAIYPGKMCTETPNRIAGCEADSGGPLVLKGDRPIQVGIYSFGHEEGCELSYPDVYTRVSHYLDWIKRHTGLAV